MRERFSIHSVVLIVAAVLFVMALYAYLYIRQFFTPKYSSRAIVSDACPDPSAAQATKQNPNKMLFVSCGGFID